MGYLDPTPSKKGGIAANFRKFDSVEAYFTSKNFLIIEVKYDIYIYILMFALKRVYFIFIYFFATEDISTLTKIIGKWAGHFNSVLDE